MVWESENQRDLRVWTHNLPKKSYKSTFPLQAALWDHRANSAAQGAPWGWDRAWEAELDAELFPWAVSDTALQRKHQTLPRGYSEAPAGCPTMLRRNMRQRQTWESTRFSDIMLFQCFNWKMMEQNRRKMGHIFQNWILTRKRKIKKGKTLLDSGWDIWFQFLLCSWRSSACFCEH